jgi:MFS family permease
VVTPPSPLRHSFRALRHRNFRLFLAGQFVSNLGTWGQSVALGWLLYRLTDSKLVLGLSSFLTQIPALFLSPLAGVWADRWNRHRLVMATQAVAMLQAFGLAVLVLTGHEAVVPVLALNLLLGLASAADVPARQSFMIEMTSAEDLPNAIALNSSVFNLARLVGPAVAGPLIVTVGEGHVFLLNALSYVAVLAALLAMRVPPTPPRASAAPELWTHLREGFRYVAGFGPIRALLLLLAMVSLLGTPNIVLLPAFARDVLGGDAHTLSYLVSAVGVGALVGALYMASRRSVRGLSLLILVAVTLFGASLIGLALAPSIWVAVPILAVTGFGMMTMMASTNTMLQTLADPAKRGRVMSFFTVAFMGTAPIGGLVLGAAADRFGAPWTTGVSGCVCLAAAAVFARARPALRDQIRPIYAKLGVIPEVANGLRAGDQAQAGPRS